MTEVMIRPQKIENLEAGVAKGTLQMSNAAFLLT